MENQKPSDRIRELMGEDPEPFAVIGAILDYLDETAVQTSPESMVAQDIASKIRRAKANYSNSLAATANMPEHLRPNGVLVKLSPEEIETLLEILNK